jgi:hypothetical protein
MRDEKFRTVCLWIAVFGVALSLASLVSHSLIPFILPSMYVVGGCALVVFLRILFSRFYRRGIDGVNKAIQGTEAWPGKGRSFFDPEWGLFGKRAGTPLLLWVRALLPLGIVPAQIVQEQTGVEVGWLWFASTFVVMELSLMHAVIYADLSEG